MSNHFCVSPSSLSFLSYSMFLKNFTSLNCLSFLYLTMLTLFIQSVQQKIENPPNLFERIRSFWKKIFQTKVVGFKKIYLLILSDWSWVASPKLDHDYLEFFKWKPLFFIVYLFQNTTIKFFLVKYSRHQKNYVICISNFLSFIFLLFCSCCFLFLMLFFVSSYLIIFCTSTLNFTPPSCPLFDLLSFLSYDLLSFLSYRVKFRFSFSYTAKYYNSLPSDIWFSSFLSSFRSAASQFISLFVGYVIDVINYSIFLLRKIFWLLLTALLSLTALSCRLAFCKYFIHIIVLSYKLNHFIFICKLRAIKLLLLLLLIWDQIFTIHNLLI